MRTFFLAAIATFGLSFSTLVRAEAVDIVAAGHGATCEAAKSELQTRINSSDNSYTPEQGDTRQFPTIAAALTFCQGRPGSADPYAEPPAYDDSALFPLPTEIYNVAHHPCSYVDSDSGRVYGVGYKGSSACYIP